MHERLSAGETASRLLENVGIVVNKNTLPGDATAGDSSGLRFGIPWVTQRGITKEQIETLARVTKDVLYNAHGFQIWAPSGDEKCRARMPYEVLQKAKREIKGLARSLPYPKFAVDAVEDNPFKLAAVVGDRTLIRVHGEKSRLAINQLLSCSTHALKEGETGAGYLFDTRGNVIDFVAVTNIGRTLNAAYGPNGADQYVIAAKTAKVQQVVDWLNAASGASFRCACTAV
jgi:glycine hydroxymethyltransferase